MLSNQSLGEGKVVEMGGQWIGSTQNRMYELASELGIKTFPSYAEGDELFFLDEKRYRYAADIPPLGARTIENRRDRGLPRALAACSFDWSAS